MQSDTMPVQSKKRSGEVVYVIDDDGDFRRSLHFLLQAHGICVSPYVSGVQFLSELDTLKAAPVILDLRMPDMDGTQVLRQLAARKNKWPVIMLSGNNDIGLAVQSLKYGAVDFLQKPAAAETLLAAIDVAFEKLVHEEVGDDRRDQAAQRVSLLTPREIEVLNHLCEGRSNKQVAFALSISPRTVEMHRANALRQLKVRSLVEAATLRRSALNR